MLTWALSDGSSSTLVIGKFFRSFTSETTQFLIRATLQSWSNSKKKMWVLFGNTSHLFSSVPVTDSFIVVTLKGQSDWALITVLITGVLLKWKASHPSEAIRHALHWCISVLSALKGEIHDLFSSFSLFIYCWRSPCGVCHDNRDWFQTSTPKAQNWHQQSREYIDNSKLEANPELFIPCPALKGKSYLPIIKGKAVTS